LTQLISILVALGVAGLYRVGGFGRRAIPFEHRLRAASRRPAIGWLVVAGMSLVVNFSIGIKAGVPDPHVHDEFSYLLAADTFAHGRLSNPTHPLWPFFVTFHELQRPSYMSKYPPGQGLILACGQLLDGTPILGAWLAAAALCVAVGWALAAFVSPGWSVLGAAGLAVHPCIAMWSQSYWGGSVAAVGGALVLGAWGRIAHGRASRNGWWAAVALGVGCGVLAMSRPYEGAALAVAAFGWLALTRSWRGLLIALAAAMPLLGWLGYYNHRVTGSALGSPYLTYERQYAIAPPFLWQPLRTPSELASEPAVMRTYAQQVEAPHFLQQQTVRGFVSVAGSKIGFLAASAASPWIIALAALAALLAVARDRRLWMAVLAAAVVLIATLASNWTRTQYVAPATAAVTVLMTAGAAEMARRWPALGRGVVAGMGCGMLAITGATRLAETNPSQRAIFTAALQHEGGQHLVFVRYLPGHELNDAWVFNDANIDAQAVVWANDLGESRDEKLIQYFPQRAVWAVEVGPEKAVLQRYQSER
jgi:hypothetical protein